MLPMSAYAAAYVHLLPKMRGVYVLMCFFWVLARGAHGHSQNGPFGQNVQKLYKIGHTMSRHNRARCGGELHEARHSAEPNKMDTSGAEVQLTLAPEWSI